MSSANTSTLYTGNCFAYLVRPSRGVSVMVSSSSSCIGVFQIGFLGLLFPCIVVNLYIYLLDRGKTV